MDLKLQTRKRRLKTILIGVLSVFAATGLLGLAGYFFPYDDQKLVSAFSVWGNAGQVASALAAIGIAAFLYNMDQKAEARDRTLALVQQWQTINTTVLSDEKLLQLAGKNHPIQELTVADTRRLYLHFLKLNTLYVAFVAGDSLDADVADEVMINDAKISYMDKKFVEKHVLPRGYSPQFRESLEKLWRKVEAGEDGKRLKKRSDLRKLT